MLICAFSLNAQQTDTKSESESNVESADSSTGDSGDSQSPADSSADTPDSSESKSAEDAEDSDQQKLQETYGKDIDTASYNELVSWCKALGLDYSGTASSLKSRLKKYYDVKGSSASSSGSGNKNLEIQHTDTISYYKINEIDEDYIELTGNIEVFMDDNGTTHVIKADYMIFNKKQKLLTAIGNVSYRKKSSGSENEDVFLSETMTFNIDNWTGYILKGVSEQEKELEDEDSNEYSEKFYYRGERIIKGEGDNMTLEKGVITSSNPENPHYSISADKMWVLGPGEWAVKNARLTIGEVPILPLPFLLKWGDHFFFNPVVGKDDSRGYFVQTSTYILGEKEEDEDSTFSFLDPSSGESDSDKEIDGFFLRPVKEDEDKEKKSDKELSFRENLEAQGAKVKFMFDLYTDLGFMVGIDGNLNKIEIDFEKLKNEKKKNEDGKDEKDKDSDSKTTKIEPLKISSLKFVLALSASMLDNGFHFYNDSYLMGSKIAYSPIWKKSYLLNPLGLIAKDDPNTDFNEKTTNIELPLLYYFDIDTSLTWWKYNSQIKFAYNSGEDILNDFLRNRKENFDFKQIFGMSDDSSNSTSSNYSSEVNWIWKNSFSGNLVDKDSQVYPYISSFQFKDFSLNMYFSRSNYTKTFNLYDSLDATAVSNTTTQSVSFLKPENFTIPIEFSLAGNIFDFSYSDDGLTNNLAKKSSSKSSETKKEDKKNYKYSEDNFLLLPWEKELESEEKEELEEDESLKIPDVIGDMVSEKELISSYLDQKLSWNLSKFQYTMKGTYDQPETTDPQDVGFQLKEFKMTLAADLSLNYEGKFLGDMIVITNSMNLKTNYSKTEDLREYDSNKTEKSETERLEYLEAVLQDKKDTSVLLSDSFKLSMKPFKFLPYVSGAKIDYSINADIVEYAFNEIKQEFEAVTPSMDYSKLTTHTLNFSLPFTFEVPQFYYNTESITLGLSLNNNLLFNSQKGSVTPSFNYSVGPLYQKFDFQFNKAFYQASGGISTEELQENELEDYQSWYINNLSVTSNMELFNNKLISVYSDDFEDDVKRDILKVNNKISYNYLTGEFSAINVGMSLDFLDLKTFFPDYKSEYLLKLTQDISFSNKESDNVYPDSIKFGIDLWKFNLDFNAKRDYAYKFDEDSFQYTADTEKSTEQLRVQSLTFSFAYDYISPAFWKDRIRLGFGIDASFTNDFFKLTNSSLKFGFKFKLRLFEYLDFFIQSESLNSVPFLYSESIAKDFAVAMGQPELNLYRNFLEDVFVYSMSADQNKRSQAYFKLKSIKFGFIHHFDDWDLNFVYYASPPKIVDNADDIWDRSFAFYITWKGIKPIKSKISYESTYEGDQIFIE
jgi:hypothetical protein